MAATSLDGFVNLVNNLCFSKVIFITYYKETVSCLRWIPWGTVMVDLCEI